MLDRATLPLTKAQIDNFVLEKEYTNYLTLQQAIAELCDIQLITTETFHNRTQLMLTEEGKATISLFHKQISDAIKQEINDYLKENAVELRNEVSVTGQYNNLYQFHFYLPSAISYGPLLFFHTHYPKVYKTLFHSVHKVDTAV